MIDFSRNLWLVGSGTMARAYASVLQAQDVPFRVIGRSPASAESFRQATGIPVMLGGLDVALAEMPPPQQAIVAVGIDQLKSVSQDLIGAGCKRILLEKPGALHLVDLEGIESRANRHNANVWIAYNRRFYASVNKLRELVIEDGGITSAVFEFTEWAHKISYTNKVKEVMERWLLSNSSHVLDLVFSFIGLPAHDQWHAWAEGSLAWHPSGARFNGAGLSEAGIPFSYYADWESSGRWGIEILTRKNKYILKPLEILQVIPKGSVKMENITLDDSLDKRFKPGIYLQCQDFLKGDDKYLCSLIDQIKAFPLYARIAAYHP